MVGFGPDSIDEREFRRTYFTLRAWLVLSCLLVVSAPVSILVLDEDFPPSISDSWHDGARMPFVFGLAMASVLLLVIVGDTLFEHVMLKSAGMFGLAVASMPCWPKNPDGTKVGHYPNAIRHEALVTTGVVLLIGALGFAAHLWLAERMDRADPASVWKPKGTRRLVLTVVCPVIWLTYAIWFIVDRDQLVLTMHLPSAIAMFVCLALIAFARTTKGLDLIGFLFDDGPVDRGPTTLSIGDRPNSYSQIYGGIALAIPIGLVIAVVAAYHSTHLFLVIEFVMLGIFLVFWVAQTLEGLGQVARKSGR